MNALSLLSGLSQAEARGLKNPEAVKAKQRRREEAERQAKATSGAGGGGEPAMKVSYPYITVSLYLSRFLLLIQWTVD